MNHEVPRRSVPFRRQIDQIRAPGVPIRVGSRSTELGPKWQRSFVVKNCGDTPNGILKSRLEAMPVPYRFSIMPEFLTESLWRIGSETWNIRLQAHNQPGGTWVLIQDSASKADASIEWLQLMCKNLDHEHILQALKREPRTQTSPLLRTNETNVIMSYPRPRRGGQSR